MWTGEGGQEKTGRALMNGQIESGNTDRERGQDARRQSDEVWHRTEREDWALVSIQIEPDRGRREEGHGTGGHSDSRTGQRRRRKNKALADRLRKTGRAGDK